MTSFALKIIAIIAMTIDHFIFTVGQSGLIDFFHMSMGTSYIIIEIMSVIGRMAFPLFAFMIAEGCHKTGNIRKYAGRLAIFALISEPFFYFANHYKQSVTFRDFLVNLSELHFENIFFTLAVSVTAIYIYQILKAKLPDKAKYLYLPLMLAAAYIAQYFDMDYGMWGVILIMALYVCNSSKGTVIVILLWSVCVYGIQGLIGTRLDWPQIRNVLGQTAGAALSCLPVWFYNGNRGRKSKWFFYIYYPAHLLLYTIIGMIALT